MDMTERLLYLNEVELSIAEIECALNELKSASQKIRDKCLAEIEKEEAE